MGNDFGGDIRLIMRKPRSVLEVLIGLINVH